MKERVLDQWVVCYGKKETVFDTAYDQDQLEQATKRCRAHHGQKCDARAVLAKKRMSRGV